MNPHTAMPRPALQADPVPPTTAAHPPRRGGLLHTLLREPLLHFVLLGAALFGIDAALNQNADDPRRIVIDAAVDQQAIDVFRKARGRAPNEEELYALRRVWLDNEVLYREGLAMQMDQGDESIRDRVIFKALSSINATLKLPPVDDAVLRSWFEKNRSKYDEPPRHDFSEAVVPEANPGEATARALASALNQGSGGDTSASLRVFKGRPLSNIEQSYGQPFAQALRSAPPNVWLALPHGAIWRVVRPEGSTPGVTAQFDAVRARVLQDWTDAVMADQRAAALKLMARNYRIEVREARP